MPHLPLTLPFLSRTGDDAFLDNSLEDWAVALAVGVAGGFIFP